MTAPDEPVVPPPGVTPAQAYIAPSDLASIGPLWAAEVQQLLPVVAQVFQESASKIGAGLAAAADLPSIPMVSSLAAETYLADVKNVYDGIGDDLWRNAQSEMLEGFKQGESIDEIALRLRQSAGMTAKNAVLVARSAVIEASNAGSIATARASQLEMLKEWIATADRRTRPTHRAADGQRVPLNGQFKVGGFDADVPGDPTLPADEKLRCRCTIGYLMGKSDIAQAHEEQHQAEQEAALPNSTVTDPQSTIGEPQSSIDEPLAVVEPRRPAITHSVPGRGELTEQESRAATRRAARERHRAIAQVEPAAKLQADVDHILGVVDDRRFLDDATTKALTQALDDAKRAGLSPDDLGRIERAVADRNAAAIEDTAARLANERGLSPIGRRGEMLDFDPATMEPISADVTFAPGQRVEVWRQGHTFSIDGDTVQLDRAIVKTAPEPIAPARARAPRKAAAPKAKAPRTKVKTRGAPNEGQPPLDELLDTFRRGKSLDRELAEQAIRDGIDGQYGAFRVEVDAIAKYDTNAIYVNGRIIDADGLDVGEFSRIFRTERGKWIAKHEGLELQPQVQGTGLATDFNQNLFDWYRRSGFDRVETYANIDVGGYTWATQGFDFAAPDAVAAWANGTDEALGVLTKLDKLDLNIDQTARELGLTHAEAERQLMQYRAMIDEALSGRRHVSAFEFSQYGRQAGQSGREATWLGKKLMLQSHWDAVKPL